MLQSVKELYGKKLGAYDGEIGHVKDFYFDDQNWAIRYLVADADAWLPGRQVLISPHSLGRLDPAGEILHVNLTRKQIENSPSIEPHKRVSRKYEEEFYQYYGWPSYWHGGGLWGMIDFPDSELPENPFSQGKSAATNGTQSGPVDAHLRATRAAGSHDRGGTDWMRGDLCDYMIDPRSWAIRQVIIQTGRRLSCKEIGIPTDKVEQIAWAKSTMLVSLMKEATTSNSARCLAPAGGTD